MKIYQGFWDNTKTEYAYAFFFIALFTLPVWLFTYPAHQDAYSHLYNTYILKKIIIGDTFFKQYFAFNPVPTPNLINRFFLTPFFFILSPLIAVKLLVTVYLVSLPLTFLYAAKTFSRRISWYCVLLILPLAYNSLYHKGFYNFIFTLPLLFFFIGYWERKKSIKSWKNWITLFIVFILAYLTHIMAVITINIYVCMRIAFDFFHSKQERKYLKGQIFNYVSSSFLINLLLLYFMYKFHSKTTPPKSLYIYFHDTLAFFLYAFKSYSYWDLVPVAIGCLALAYLIVRMLLHRLRDFSIKKTDIFAVIALIFIFFYYLTGQHWYLQHRLAIIAICFVLLWVALQIQKFDSRRILVASCIALLFWGYEIHTQAMYAPMLRDYAALGEYVQPHETFLGLTFEEEGFTRTNPLVHFSGMFSAQNELVNLYDYQADSGFPVTYKTPHPAQLAPDFEHPIRTDPDFLNTVLLNFPVDHVMIHIPKPESQSMRPFLEVLARYYDQVAQDKAGNLILYARKQNGESLQGLSDRLD